MTGLVRKATLLAVCGVLAASAAFASVPSPSNSTVPACISLVGNNGGVIDPAGQFTVTVRDLANVPINNSLVVVDFSACSGLTLCNTGAFAGVTLDCGTQTARAFTGVGGTVTFRIAGHANNSGNQPPYATYNDGKVFADGVQIGQPTVHAFDHNASGMGAADLSAWLGDFFGGNNPSRSDYDCTGALGAADLSTWLGVFFGNGSVSNCPASGTQCSAIP